MSVDDRLREAFGETDRTWDDQVPTALADLLARQRRETVVRRGAAAGLVAAAAVAVVAVTIAQRGGEHPLPSHDPTTPPTTSTVGPSDVPASLVGHWLTRPITRADVRRAVRDAGSADQTDQMLAGLPDLPFRIVLVINGARREAHLSLRSGGDTEPFDQENLEVRDDQLTISPMFAVGENMHTWSVEHGVLRMDFVSSTEADTDVVPAEAWQRLLYDTAAFTHVG
jgi:hypothetical protein